MDETAFYLDEVDEFEDMQSPMNLVTVAIVGACIEVHRQLGPGFGREVYADALAHELELRGAAYVRNRSVALDYKGKPVGSHVLDFIVEDMVVLKIKTVKFLRPVHQAAMVSYLKASNKRLGLIVNFNTKILMNGVERVALKD